MSIEIFERGDRGFHGYGPPVLDSYGSAFEVYESSRADGPHVWVKVFTTPAMNCAPGEGALHLTPGEAQALVDRLQAWLLEIPGRWDMEKS